MNMENITPQSLNVYFFLWAAVLIFFMKAGFVLLEIGQIRRKNVGAHMTLKFLDMSVVLIVYLFFGYAVSYGMQFIGGVLTPGGTDVGSYAHSVSYTHLRAHETRHDLVCRLLLEKKKK